MPPREEDSPRLIVLAQPDSFSAFSPMQLHPSANVNGNVPAATSVFVFVLVCALLAFAVFI